MQEAFSHHEKYSIRLSLLALAVLIVLSVNSSVKQLSSNPLVNILRPSNVRHFALLQFQPSMAVKGT
jgi:hypothetical protein